MDIEPRFAKKLNVLLQCEEYENDKACERPCAL